MKRITLKSNVRFTERGAVKKVFVFEKGKTYEVEDSIADNAFIKERLASVEVLKKPAAKRRAKKEVSNESGSDD
jgi:hypothetical protein|nr:MAG TPA: hypothetical protein [Caudoviricetes sp.]